jgi:hypothetical protein
VTLLCLSLRHFDHATIPRTDNQLGRARYRLATSQDALPLSAKAFAIVKSLMENLAIATDEAFRTTLRQTQAKPTRLLHQAYTPLMTH